MKKSKYYFLFALLFITFHFIFLMMFFEPAIFTPDAQGYFTQAKLIATEGTTSLKPESPLEYIGPHWNQASNGRYYATFPPGFPFLLSLFYKTFGAESCLYLNPILASLSLLGLFLVVRLWLGDIWGLTALSLLAVNPFANEHALFGDSHTSVIFFLIFGLFFLTIWLKKKWLWSIFFAGFCFGVIPTIRYAESLLLIVFFIFLLLSFQKNKTYYSSLVLATVGTAIPTVALAIRNQIAFGSFYKTGYELSNNPARFGFSYFLQHFAPYTVQLLSRGVGVLFVTGLAGGVFLIIRKEFRLLGFFFLLLILPLTFLYMAYFWPVDLQSMRFLLPTFPIYMILTVWLMKFLLERNLRIGIFLTVLIVILAVITGVPSSLQSLKHLQTKSAVLVKITDAVKGNVVPGSILIANEGILQNLDLLGKWKLASIPLPTPAPGRPNPPPANQGAPLSKRRIRNVKAYERYSKLSKGELFEAITRDLLKWSNGGKEIYLLGKEVQIFWLLKKLPKSNKLTLVKRIDIPDLGGLLLPRLRNRQRQRPEFDKNWRRRPRRMPLPNQIYDFFIDGKPLFLVGWKLERVEQLLERRTAQKLRY
jgi:hypothetical protein